MEALGWQDDAKRVQARQQGIERQLFLDLSPEEQRIVEVLTRHNDLQINLLTIQADIPITRLPALLFNLEMKGVLKELAGGVYHLYK